MCGHMGQEEARAICNLYGQELTKRGFQQCSHCGKAKAKQLAVAQNNEDHVVAGPEEHRIFIDLSSVKHGPEKKKKISRPYWMLIVVELMNFKVSEFINRKIELPEKACKTVRKLKQAGLNIKFVRLYNAGENKLFASIANNHIWNLQLTFKFTGAHTPQRNYLAEIGFSTLWGRLQAMFDAAFVPEEEKYKLIKEGIHHLTFLDGLIVRTLNGTVKTKFGHIYGEDLKVIMPMRLWGEAGIVKVMGKIKSKLEMRGKEAMFVGYVVCSTGDTYRMYVPEIDSIHESRDVQWRKRMFFDTESNESIHAADSVELIVNNKIVPLRTNAPPITNPIPQHNVNDGAVKGQAKFKAQVEYVLEYEEEEEPKVLQEGSESRSEEDEEGNEEGLYEEEVTSGSSFNPTASEVDSTYSEEDEFFEDDEAFFERLAEMTARIDAESGTDEDTPIESDDARDREATGANMGLRRSSRTIRALRRCQLILWRR
jgi:hypothetical protein